MDWLYELFGVNRTPSPATYVPARITSAAPNIKSLDLNTESTNKVYKYRVVTNKQGKYTVQMSEDGVEWRHRTYYDFSPYGPFIKADVHDTLSAAISKVDELVEQQSTRILNAARAGQVVYGPRP